MLQACWIKHIPLVLPSAVSIFCISVFRQLLNVVRPAWLVALVACLCRFCFFVSIFNSVLVSYQLLQITLHLLDVELLFSKQLVVGFESAQQSD